jgi:hypothetical protein
MHWQVTVARKMNVSTHQVIEKKDANKFFGSVADVRIRLANLTVVSIHVTEESNHQSISRTW